MDFQLYITCPVAEEPICGDRQHLQDAIKHSLLRLFVFYISSAKHFATHHGWGIMMEKACPTPQQLLAAVISYNVWSLVFHHNHQFSTSLFHTKHL